jgi:hypothetical protein
LGKYLSILWELNTSQNIPTVRPTRCICFSNYLFLQNTSRVSDGLSVHHQEFKTEYTSTGICQTDAATCCCMCSLELLMMEGKTVRNM